ncbi:hypothetical protein [Yoonia sp.]|uniref:hypothetical protein n=1 Tax=Yoonia sp. TaxID=2212373 RepID=UPI002DFE01E0|nr:hypothetical protein [Yoonia sp.]
METRDLLADVSDNICAICIGYASGRGHLVNRTVSELLELENATLDRSAKKFPIDNSSFFRALHLGPENSVLLGGSQVRVPTDLARQCDVVQFIDPD